MASLAGGHATFSTTTLPVNLGINDGTKITPAAKAGAFNLEVFTSPAVSGVPAPDPGWDAALTDPGGTIDSAGFLTGTNYTFGPGAYMIADNDPGAVFTLTSGNQTVVGAITDTLVGGSADQVLDASAGRQSVVGGTSGYTVFGGANDTITGNSGVLPSTEGQITGGLNEQVVVPVAGNYTIGGGAGMKITAANGTANVNIGAAASETINLTGNSGFDSVNATAGNDAVTVGGGTSTVYGGLGDTLTGGAGGTAYLDASAGSQRVVVGAGGAETIVGGSNDTFVGGAASAYLSFIGSGSLVNLVPQTGSLSFIPAAAGGSTILLGGVAATVVGGAGDSVTFGSVSQSADGTGGSQSFTLGSAGTDTVTGSNVAAKGDTINPGSGASLYYNVGTAGGDLINMAGSKGNGNINAVAGGPTLSVKDTVISGNGADTVAAGDADRVGVGPTSPGGTHIYDHSKFAPAASSVAFGTNDSVTAVTYSGSTSTRSGTVSGASSALVTVSNFNTATDTVFYPGENAGTDAGIRASATTGPSGTTITLPDGTTMFFAGLGSAAALKFTS